MKIIDDFLIYLQSWNDKEEKELKELLEKRNNSSNFKEKDKANSDYFVAIGIKYTLVEIIHKINEQKKLYENDNAALARELVEYYPAGAINLAHEMISIRESARKKQGD